MRSKALGSAEDANAIRFVRHIDQLITESEKTQAEIARELGYPKANIITMFKSGTTRVPVDKVPLLADSLGVDRIELLTMWLQDYQPVLFEVISSTIGPRVSATERTWLRGLRKTFPHGLPVFDEIAEEGLKRAGELAGARWKVTDKAAVEKQAKQMEAMASAETMRVGREEAIRARSAI